MMTNSCACKAVISRKGIEMSEKNRSERSEVPPLLQTISGRAVTDREIWEKYRRPEILSLYEDHVYGRNLLDSGEVHFAEVQRRTPEIGEGETEITVQMSVRGVSFPFYITLPAGADRNHPVSALMWPDFAFGPDQVTGIVLRQHVAAIRFPVKEAAADGPEAKQTGLFTVCDAGKPDAWGAIGLWAWCCGQILGYAKTREELRPDRISIAGHSRGGKTALWSFAENSGFHACLSLNSGCGGASLFRHKNEQYEDVKRITERFPYWFAGRLSEYADREAYLPVDQHMLIALAAPRPVYVVSGTEDIWSDPDGELASEVLASPVWRLYGREGLVLPENPEPGKAYESGRAAYFRRIGGHMFTEEDWVRFIRFAGREE